MNALPRSPVHTLLTSLVACLTTVVEPVLAAPPDPSAPAAARSAVQKQSLDLKIGDIRRYVDPAFLDTPLPDELEEIIVNGQRPEPLPEQRVVPRGLGSLLYAARNPLQAWRILVPDPNLVIPERTEDDAREPPGAFRGRILAPGRIYE